ncbi:hypothetical protein CHN50_20935 [Priestia aryabhattai]|nr:hypothetical protein CHN50_20935 [Priestia aryabhattai]
MSKVVHLQTLREERIQKEQLYYILGFVQGRFPEADPEILWDLIYKAFLGGYFDIKTLKEFTFTWDKWSQYKRTIEGCIEYAEELGL